MDILNFIPNDRQLLESIEAFIARHNMAPTRFGREAANEPAFIQSLRDGRAVTLKTANRLVAFMKQHDALLAADAAEASPDNSQGNIGAADSTPSPIPQGSATPPGRPPAAGVCGAEGVPAAQTSSAAGQGSAGQGVAA
ncbi:hypothetical protein [Sphingorhabdus pulchriflava]|nr:hypothetical protein [Sphingorhabdus pulchriflava]